MTRCTGNKKNNIYSICPHTGAPTYTRPEWTDVVFDNNYHLSITIIKESILCVQIEGFSTYQVVADSTNFTKQVIEEVFIEGAELLYVGNFVGVTGLTMEARKYYAGYLKSIKQLKTFILCSPSPFLPLAGNLSMRFNIVTFDIIVKKSYANAVEHAVWMTDTLGGDGGARKPPYLEIKDYMRPPGTFQKFYARVLPYLKNEGKFPAMLKRVTRPEWTLTFDTFTVRFEIINGNIIHKVSKGVLSVEHVRPVYKMQEQIARSFNLQGRTYYILNGTESLQGSTLKARKFYAQQFAQWVDYYPYLNKVFIYGANRLLRAGLCLSLYTRPVSIAFTNNIEEAINQIKRHRVHRPSMLPGSLLRRFSHSNSVQYYAKELNCFLGDINWEVEGTHNHFTEKSDDHPFKTAYDAIKLIKSDIDELFRDREAAQVALQESEEMSRALLNATQDLSLLVQADGAIIAVNRTFATAFGLKTGRLKGLQLADFLPQYVVDTATPHFYGVIETGHPARFEIKLNNKYYENTIYPVFNPEKTVDRLALYSRDVTGLKQAHDQIHVLTQELIKAQENERRRIARDLHDNVAQDLASLIISNESLFDGHADVPLKVKQRNRSFSRVLKKAIASIRDLVYDLRPPGLTEIGLVKTVHQYCLDFSEKNGVDVIFYSAGLERIELDTDTKINLFRIFQEALNNAKKHAEAQCINVRLIASHPDMILRIEDDGCGFNPAVRMMTALHEKRMGLKSMEERVNLISGELSINSREGSGTRIVVKFPYNQYTKNGQRCTNE